MNPNKTLDFKSLLEKARLGVRRSTEDFLLDSTDLLKDLTNALEQTIKERDDARRQLASVAVGKVGKSKNPSPDAVEYAESRGWDCFAS